MKTLYPRKLMKITAIITLIAFSFSTISCKNYYKVNTETTASASRLNDLENIGKYLIIHSPKATYKLNNFKIVENNITGTTVELPAEHRNYIITSKNKKNRYKNTQKAVLDEVHIYTSKLIDFNENVDIPLNTISKIELYDKDKEATTASWILGGIGYTVATLAVVTILIALLKSSCPYIYTNDGNAFTLQGELYGGATYASMERNDFLKLNELKAINGTYDIKISNELLEKQYTNLVELVVVNHPYNTSVLADKYGTIYSISDAKNPKNAVSCLGTNYSKELTQKDNHFYSFNEDNKTTDFNSITLTFDKDNFSSENTAKLILNGKNSYWLDYVYNEFSSLFGNKFNQFEKKQEKNPAEKNYEWMMKQGILLSVYLQTDTGWEFVDYFNLIGPLAKRDMVMPIDISKIKGKEVVVKIESGFQFWDLDYAAMDFSQNTNFETTYIKPIAARDFTDSDVSKLILNDDNKYLSHINVGDQAVIQFKEVLRSDKNQQTFLLHTKGYYKKIREYKGKPNLNYLKTFQEPKVFTEFSKKRFYTTCENLGITLNQ